MVSLQRDHKGILSVVVPTPILRRAKVRRVYSVQSRGEKALIRFFLGIRFPWKPLLNQNGKQASLFLSCSWV